MNLLISPECNCIKSKIDGRLFALCSRCRAAQDPDFAERCAEAPPRKEKKNKRGRRPQKRNGKKK